MKTFFYSTIAVAGLLMMSACGGGNSNQNTEPAEGQQTEESAAVAEQAPQQEVAKAEEAAAKEENKEWWKHDFTITEKMYVGKACMERTYARKGNILIGVSEGSGMTNLFVCTDSTRTLYTIGNEKGTYIKRHEKTGFDGVDDAVYKYLKDQMSNTVFGKKLKVGEEGTTVRDTVIFGRPAYIITKEKSEKNSVLEVWGKTIMYIDKENGLPYYKWSIMKNNGKVMTEGKAFEVTAFSAEPDYEGLIMSLDGLTEIK
ncbi:MAG: hypothetical protein IK041_07095 [Bacteroidales bacterium]|nr:hypothetical protein [Bacteroidales bacterium]